MYTQCPNCATALRVTADVLKQAAGKVRCGGCHKPFNALLYLSETKPAARPRQDDDEESLPELKPEPDETPRTPASPISAAQSAALLKTLDQLAGEDIRIEDTGVEWRLLDEDEDDGDVDDNYADDPGASFTDTEVGADDAGDIHSEVDRIVEFAGDSDAAGTAEERTSEPGAARQAPADDDTGIHYAAIGETEEQPVNDDVSVNDIFADTGVPIDTIIFGSNATAQIDELLHQDDGDAQIDERLDDDAGAAKVDELLDDDAGDANVDELLDSDAGNARIDEVLEHAATPVDEFLTDSPNAVEAGEVFDDPVHETATDNDGFGVFDDGEEDNSAIAAQGDDVDTPAPAKSIEDELRFDDNTGLPDNFDFDSLPQARAANPEPAGLAAEPVSAEFEKEITRVDLALDDDDEWDDLLEEVDQALVSPVAKAVSEALEPPAAADTEAVADPDESAPGAVPAAESRPLTLEEELAALPDEDDDDPVIVDAAPLASATPLASAVPLDIDTQFGLQAKAMGIDLSGLYASQLDTEETASDDEDAAQLADAAEVESPATVAAVTNEDKVEANADAEDKVEDEFDSELLLDDLPDEELAAADDESAAIELALEETGDPADSVAEAAADDDPATGEDVAASADDDVEAGKAQSSETVVDIDQPLQAFPANTSELEFELSQAQKLVGDDDVEFNPEVYVPPPTEEENTVNMMIDQDLMRLAITDDDGMASTMVLEGKQRSKPGKQEGDSAGEGRLAELEFDLSPEDADGFESIIMEGDYVRTEAEQARLAAEAKARSESGQPSMPDAVQQAMSNEAAKKGASQRRFGYGIIAGIVVLVLLLAGQFVHQSRAELATVPAVASTIEPVYRAVGAPITPNWDVSGWRFEVTKGSTSSDAYSGTLPGTGTADSSNPGGGPEVLTIESRLGNKSAEALPYPLISVSLTDRFEETIGNRVLEPADYLPDSTDAQSMVGPGATFNAVIAVRSPSPEATGFKLNVCYRQNAEQLRCAIEDFK